MTVLPGQSRTPGTYSFGPVDIPDGLSSVTCSLNRNSWPNTGAEVVKARIEISTDGGLTYPYAYGVGAMGGIHRRKRDNQIQNATTLTFDLPAGSGRKARGEVQIIVALNLQCDVTWQ